MNRSTVQIKRPEIRRSSVMVHKILPSFPVENNGKLNGRKRAKTGVERVHPQPTVQHCPHRGHPHLTGRDNIAPTQGLGEVAHLQDNASLGTRDAKASYHSLYHRAHHMHICHAIYTVHQRNISRDKLTTFTTN